MAGGMFSNFTSSLKGIFADGAAEKAILYIYLADISKGRTQEESDEDILATKDKEKELMKKTKDTLGFGDTMKGIGGGIVDFFKPGAKSKQKVGDLDKDGKFLKFTFQYNPATLRLYSVNGKLQSKSDNNGTESLRMTEYAGKTKLSFDIVFDDCDNMNAFMFNDIANLNVTGAINKGLSLLQSGGNTHSVRKRMDAIMSLLSSPSTQQVIFFWSRMVFRGTVTSVTNTYTMFNPKGNPIRGTMHLEITQDKAYSQRKLYDEKYWENAFNEAFKPPKGGIGPDGVAGVCGGQSWLDKATNNPFLNI